MKRAIEIYEKMKVEDFGFLEVDALRTEYFGNYKNILNIEVGVGPGWWGPIKKLFVALDELCGDSTKITIQQIKEKFGTLRIYYSLDAPDQILRNEANVLVRNVERECAARCEICGDPGERRALRWVKTYCDKHYQAYSNNHG